jgi:hypothetical protein
MAWAPKPVTKSTSSLSLLNSLDRLAAGEGLAP